MEFHVGNEGSSSGLISSTLYQMIKSVRQTIKVITKEKGGLAEVSHNHYLNGTFKQLCDPQQMIDILFPGTSKDILNGLPKNLKDVLQWNELVLDINKIAKNADEVLQNIKVKGAQQGDIMDETTENVLLPQIAQEALAKEIIDGVRKLSRRVSSMNAKISLKVASPEADEAEADQLDDEVVKSLLSSNIAVESEFCGEEWTNLIRDDILRYIRDERMSAVGDDGAVQVAPEKTSTTKSAFSTDAKSKPMASISWLDTSSNLGEVYPALTEAVKMLHSLPFELNRKIGSPEMQMLEPSKGCTMLVRYPPGAQQMFRIDSRDDGSDADSGIRITCSFHVTAAPNTSVERGIDPSKSDGKISGEASSIESNIIQFQGYSVAKNSLIFAESSNENKLIREVPIANDMLTLHKAAHVRNARSEVTSEYYVLVFFIQAKAI